ncbi:MAG: glycoside hydrolase family 13 protein, partial [Chloroflexi bacterium]|nr:glycoside hydrolase family 13 protein [Chloroflexota bacterium]
MIKTPEWVKDAVFYEIFPDSFAKSTRVPKPNNLDAWDSKPSTFAFKGGDLLGVEERLDYLQELGITAIYFTPIFQSTANHRYHTHDYFRVDPILGGDKAFRALLDSAHKRNIRVVIDGVFNHASRGFYQFNHSLENGATSPYIDWFNIKGFPLHAYEGKPVNYEAWWGIPALPKFNTNLPAVRVFLYEVAEYWIRQGVDGWRLDVPGEINDDEFWREFRRRIKGLNPEAYIVGEIWHEAQRWLQGDQFDAVMNYLFTRSCIGYFVKDKRDEALLGNVGYSPAPNLDAQGFAFSVNSTLGLYDTGINQVQMNLLDSHDTARYLSIAKGDVSALKLATLWQMTYPGAPCIYYGDEIGLLGGKDPDSRRTFPWDTPEQWNRNLLQYTKDCIALRHKYAALRRGDFRFIYAEGNAVAYLRTPMSRCS